MQKKFSDWCLTKEYVNRTTDIETINTEIADLRADMVDMYYKLKEVTELLNYNIEKGTIIDESWNIRVKPSELAKKLYPDYVIVGGWLYAKKV